ncbi:NAD-dependent epimerase/dehydratase family protein [Nitratireductor sp. ZSWI3]|uniref:NAD-dependent epimerase/dehydratase family protein n=1 Tax=Nitratireductor sp. ZSWI3 TaxID=2966359 RepID=UPI00214F7D34|nr:NAD-dependent epimerase/dehydratase family protein [Nitratireductor sp. ZSWI3]MCR4265866.1 NAD-dependent epimerase/dehydratase family protein [Nitratireductor sp. ZSWI3]
MRLALVTGGSGFIGKALIDRLLSQGWSVRNVDFVASPATHARLSHWPGSFLQPELLREAMVGVDTIFHLAATNFPRESNLNPLSDCQENVIGTMKLAEMAIEAKVRRIVFSSSGGTVYGNARATPIAESHPTQPITAYGISKLACEHYLRFYDGLAKGRPLTTLSLRIGNPYGPNQNIRKAQGALTTFCYNAANGIPITIWGDGTVERDFIHISDVTRAMARAADCPAHGTEINVGSGRGTSLNQILDAIRASLGRTIDVSYTESRSFDAPSNVLSIARARELLQWEPEIGIDEGVSELLGSFL